MSTGKVDQAISYFADKVIKYIDREVTTNSSAFSGYYYVDYTFSTAIGSGMKPLGAIIIEAASNRPAFVQLLDQTKLRVWSTYSNNKFKFRLFYYVGGVTHKFLPCISERRCAA